MVRVSRYKVSDHVYSKMLTLLFEVVGRRKDKNEFLKTIFDLLTPSERIIVSKRILLMYLIIKDIDYLTICKVLKVSNNTVSRYRLVVERSEGIVPLLKKMLEKEEISTFIERMIVELFPPGTYGTDWKASWELKKAIERKRVTGV